MHITLQRNGPSKRANNRLQARFDKLCKQLDRERARNDKLAAELDALVERLQSRVREADARQIDNLVRLVERLTTFFTRKSLSRWHRDELGDWIAEILERIERVDAAAGARLRDRFHSAVAAYLDVSEAELEAETEAFAESMDAVFEEILRDAGGAAPHAETAEPADDPQMNLFGEEPEDGFDDEAGQTGAADEAATGPQDTAAQTRSLTDGSWAQALFRRAAQALHPDREPDPDRQRHKQALMQQLLAAREQADVLTLLRLYGEATGADDLALAEEQMEEACELMEERLAELRAEHEEIAWGDPLRTLAHELFYSPSRKTREQRVAAWERELEAEAEALAEVLGELRNLTVLKEHLEERRYRQMFGD